MICYNCGCRLSEHDFCTSCGVDVSLYKKVIFMSNRFYNDGLEKATVRDLSGAIVSLRQSIKFNKNNIDARNLLGLVYFEMGEVVLALREWVISKNLRPKKNIADDYINMIQNNQARLDGINQTIKKYNQALLYCYQDSKDLAVIQLKKVLSNNPKYVRAHQLLALLYMNTEEWEKAKRELVKCAQVDTGNTTTLRYLKEVDHMLMPEEASKNVPRKKAASDDIIRYQSGNETIIQPVNTGEKKGASSLLNLGIGLVIGIAIAFFLILPARIQSAKADINNELRVVSEQSDAKTATIDEQEQKIQSLTDENQRLLEELSVLEGTDGALKATDGLMMAVNTYLANPEDIKTIAGYMEALETEEGAEEEKRTESFESLRLQFLTVVGDKLAAYYYDLGNDSYREGNYEEAIPNLQRAYNYDNTNVDALFYLGNSYREMKDNDKAKEIYAQIVDNFPNTDRANKAETYLAEINNAN
ncbi:MAG: tetratricopeptide repeat protein [Suilimivivens sp.]